MRARSLLVTVWGDTIYPSGGEIALGDLVRLMAPLGLTARAVRAAALRMAHHGWLKARRVGRQAFYALTTQGAWRVEQGVRRVYRLRPDPWDGQWRLLTYTVPENRRTDRDKLRRELTWLGLGALGRSTWITPHDLTAAVEELLRARGVHNAAALFEARHLGPGEDRQLVDRCWDLAAIAERYRSFAERLRPHAEALRTRLARGALPDEACFAEKILLVHEYRKFLFVDPGLPQELLPPEWPGYDAAELFRATYMLLSDGAARFAVSFLDGDRRRLVDPFRAGGLGPVAAVELPGRGHLSGP